MTESTETLDRKDELSTEKISSVDVIDPDNIPVEFISNLNTKTGKLVNNSSEVYYMEGHNREYIINFSEVLFVTKIVISTDGYSNAKSCKFFWSDSVEGKNKTYRVKNGDNQFELVVDDFMRGFVFKPDKLYFPPKKITSVKIFGYTTSMFVEAFKSVSTLNEYKEDVIRDAEVIINKSIEASHRIEDLKQQESELNDSISELESEISDFNSQITEYKNNIQTQKLHVTSLKTEQSNIISRSEQLEDQIDKKKNEQKSLNKDISDKYSELRKLKEDINMFPSEISAFNKQGASNVKSYALLSIAPMLVLVFVTIALFSNAVDLTTVLKTEPNADILTILMTRLPFVAVAIGLISASYKVLKLFFLELMKINQQRLNLSKISIIATDVSMASSEGLQLTDDELYHFRTRLKMDLLKEHLKDYMSKDYLYVAEKTEKDKVNDDEKALKEDIDDEETGE